MHNVMYCWSEVAQDYVPVHATAGAVSTLDMTIPALAGGQSAIVAISTTSAQSAAITTAYVTVYPTVDCFFRAGANPVALSNGTDDLLIGGNKVRINGITSGDKLAFKTASGSGSVYITPRG